MSIGLRFFIKKGRITSGMRLKKANATLGLLAILILLAHAGYQVVAYFLFIYNPFVTKVLAWAAVAVVSLHAVLGMSMLMFVHDGSSARSYSGMNLRTILQRASAIGIMVMLVLHIKSFDILHAGTPGLIAAEIIQLLFFACVFTHIGTSFSNAFVTLGLLGDMDRKKKIDHAVYVICAVLWAVAVFVVGKTYIALSAMS